MSSTSAKIIENINEEDQLSADMYSFLANLFRSEPNSELINQLKVLQSDDSPIGKSIKTLSKLASSLDLPTIRDEYVRIFVGFGRREILPFASYYLTGFLKDKPLAKLRQDMEKTLQKDPCQLLTGLIKSTGQDLADLRNRLQKVKNTENPAVVINIKVLINEYSLLKN